MVRMHNDPKGGRSTRKAAGTCAMAYRRTNTRVLPGAPGSCFARLVGKFTHRGTAIESFTNPA